MQTRIHIWQQCMNFRVHKFDYNFKKFWKREPPQGVMRPFIKMDGQPNPDIVSHQVSSKSAQKK